MTGEELISFDEMAETVAELIDAKRFVTAWNNAVGSTYMGGIHPNPNGPLAAVAHVMDPDGGLLSALNMLVVVLDAPTPELGVHRLKVEIAKIMMSSDPELKAAASGYIIQEEP